MKTLAPIFETTNVLSPTIPYAWKQTGSENGPTVTILGGIHGNETVGVDLVADLLIQMERFAVKKGVLQVALGNVEGIKEGKRFIEKDLNRCFANPRGRSLEEVRAQQLKPLLMGTDILLDIHGTIKPSKPFIGTPNPDHPLGKIIPAIGIPTVVTGKGYADIENPIYADAFVAACGGLGITIEAGWIEDPDIQAIQEKIYGVLSVLGIFEERSVPVREVQTEIWDAYWNVVASEGFEFTKEWQNFEQLPAGTPFAKTPEREFSVSSESIILFPKSKPNLVIGNEACIIARKK